MGQFADLVPADGVAATTALGDATYQHDDWHRLASPILDGTVSVNTQTGTTYTLVLTDAGLVVRMTNAAASTLTVPPNSSVAFPVGTVLHVYGNGAGGLTIAAGAGVTIRNNTTALVQYQEVSLRKDGTDEWVRSG